MFRNKEIQKFSVVFAALIILIASAGFAIDLAAGSFVLVSAAAFGAAFFVFTRDRYQCIEKLSEQIDLVLHNADHLLIGETKEGELSILQSEIIKMTLRIREQNDALKREKEHLAESMADIAHQLRTPLTSVNLILSLLENQPDELERKAMIREIKELFKQMDWLLTSLLKLSRLDAGIVVFQKEELDVHSLINSAIHPFLISLELHNITLQTDVPEGIVICGDFAWLSEAFQNILKNCMESVGDNGKISITLEDNPLYTQIAIHDSGAGFAREDLPHLFERFYRGKNTDSTGYGIGLALCKTIITRQGGTITAKNHPQGGAVFFVRFSK